MIWKKMLLTFITFENQIHNINEICCCLDHVHLIFNLVSPL
jgi:REP element-mobilizing transposase RayT